MMFNWLSLVTGFFYIIMGFLVIINKSLVTFKLQPMVSYAMGGLLILYGVFRIFRAIYRLKNREDV